MTLILEFVKEGQNMKNNLIYVKNFNIFLEPETCDVYTSAGYLSNYWLRLMQAVFTPITEQHALCG